MEFSLSDGRMLIKFSLKLVKVFGYCFVWAPGFGVYA